MFCSSWLTVARNGRPNISSAFHRVPDLVDARAQPYRIAVMHLADGISSNIKKLLYGLAVLLAAAGAWAASLTSEFVARIAFVSDTHVNLRTNEPGIALQRHLALAPSAEVF